MVPSEPPATGAAPGGTDGPRLNWSACIATLNRHDVLMVALAHLLRQSRRRPRSSSSMPPTTGRRAARGPRR